MDAYGVLLRLGPQLYLRQDLVGEGVAHHEAGVSSRTSQVHQPPLGQQDDAAAIRELVTVDLNQTCDCETEKLVLCMSVSLC